MQNFSNFFAMLFLFKYLGHSFCDRLCNAVTGLELAHGVDFVFYLRASGHRSPVVNHIVEENLSALQMQNMALNEKLKMIILIFTEDMS